MGKWTGVRVRVVSTSLMSSLPSPSIHCDRNGLVIADLKLRGLPAPSMLRTGAEESRAAGGAMEGGGYHIEWGGPEGGRGARA